MKGPNRTYKIGEQLVLMRNTESTDPKWDGWWLDFLGGNAKPAPVSGRTAMFLLLGARKEGRVQRI